MKTDPELIKIKELVNKFIKMVIITMVHMSEELEERLCSIETWKIKMPPRSNQIPDEIKNYDVLYEKYSIKV